MADDEFEDLALLGFVLLCDGEDHEKKSFKQLLCLSDRRKRSGKIRRGSLQAVTNSSSFCRLFASGQDDALISLCGC